MSTEKYCKRSNHGGHFNGISAGSLSDCFLTDVESEKYRLRFASAEEDVSGISLVQEVSG